MRGLLDCLPVHRLADHLAEIVDSSPHLQLVAHNLSIVCLRSTPDGVAEEHLDGLNRRVLREVQLSGEAFLSGTDLDGRFVLRACFVNPRTTAADVRRIADAVTRAEAGENS